jgi:hypothetical protein
MTVMGAIASGVGKLLIGATSEGRQQTRRAKLVDKQTNEYVLNVTKAIDFAKHARETMYLIPKDPKASQDLSNAYVVNAEYVNKLALHIQALLATFSDTNAVGALKENGIMPKTLNEVQEHEFLRTSIGVVIEDMSFLASQFKTKDITATKERILQSIPRVIGVFDKLKITIRTYVI